jgi:hypothetical protein
MASASYPESSGGGHPLPPTISVSDKLLSSTIPLESDTSFVYATFEAISSQPQPCEALEMGRREALKFSEGKPLVQALLPSVRIGKDGGELYIFRIVREEWKPSAMALMNALSMNGLRREFQSFDYPSSTFAPCIYYSL